MALEDHPAPPRPREFEGVEVGQVLTSLTTPVVSTAQVFRWSAAIENWHRIHYDRPFAVDHDGLPDIAVPGSWKQQILYRFLRDWAGPEGWVVEMDYQFRGLDVPGFALVASGQVRRVLRHQGYGFVDCELRLARVDGAVSAQGHGIVVLPLPAGRAVPYPFSPDLVPDRRDWDPNG